MTDIEYTRDQLDARLKEIEPSLANTADFDIRRDLAYAIVMGEYNAELIEQADPHVVDDNFSSLLSSGTAVINTDIGDVYKAALPVGVVAVFGDTIFLQQGTTKFFSVPRRSIAEIVLGTPSETLYSFATHRGSLMLYSKDGEFTAPGNMAFYFFRRLDDELATGTTVLDIRCEDFNGIAERVSEYMVSG
jgi:hypothetical protein